MENALRRAGLSEDPNVTHYVEVHIEEGDLDGDGIADVVGIAKNTESFYVIAVLHGETDGSLKPWFRSKVASAYWFHNFAGIKNHSIFISENYSSTAIIKSDQYQFQLRNGRFVLIGDEHELYDKHTTDDYKDGNKKSTNYLTHKSIISEIVNDKVVTEKTTEIEHTPLLDLTEFQGS